MKKILFVTTAKKLFGSERALLSLVSHMHSDFLPIVLFPVKSELSDLFIKNNIQILIVNLSAMNWIKRIIKVHKIIKEYNISLVHVNYHSDLSQVFWAVKLTRIPFVVHVRMTADVSLFELFMYKFVNKIVCVSHAVRECILKTRRVKGLLPSRLINLEVVYDGRDIKLLQSQANRNLFRDEFNLQDEIKAIGIVGAIAPRKRQDLFLKVASEIIKTKPNVKFFIVGDLYGERHKEYLQYVETLAKQLNLSQRVIFTGRRDDIPNVMKGLDILLMLSKNDALPNVVIEAMAVGTPVVGIAVDGVIELIGDNEGGILVNSEEPSEIAKRACALIENRLLHHELCKRSKIRALKFDIRTHVESIENIYKKILLK